jgi:hypothetical protein
MTIQIGVPNKDDLVDREYVEIPGADGNSHGFQYDKETNTLFSKESQIIIPSFHGLTHVSEDPVPEATPWLRGLLSAADKAKLDALTQTRLGVLGFMGAGMPDDGGWMQGDIIFAAGSEFISLERVGNIIRFTVDTPVPLSCGCEECAQIYWIQDESDLRSVRPPSCNGIMPGINAYGELKIYAYPENQLFNANKSSDYFNQKNVYPTLQFKRYKNGNIQNLAEQHIVLRRRGDGTTNVGWSFTPGPTEIPECVWYMGSDKDGRQVTFELSQTSEPGLLGALLYNGHSITKQMAVVTGYTKTVLSTNQYNMKLWSVPNAKAIGNEFVATNVWQYRLGVNQSLVTDNLIQLLEVGELVDLWQFEISRVNNVRKYLYYFSQRPRVSQANLWSLSNSIRFGELYEQRDDTNHGTGTGTGTDLTAHIDDVSDIRVYERTQWGITGFEDPVYLANDGFINLYGSYEPSGAIINGRYQAVIDYSIPGLKIEKMVNDTRGDINHDGKIDDADLALLMASMGTVVGDTAYNPDADFNSDGMIDVRDLGIFGTNYNIYAKQYSDQPVFIWQRGNHKNILVRAKIGRPKSGGFPPIDILFGAPIDSVDDVYVKIIKRGVFNTGVFANLPYIIFNSEDFKAVPQSGTLRILTGVYRDILWKYSHKIYDGNQLILIGIDTMFPYDEDYLSGSGSTGTSPLIDTPTNSVVCQLMHADYSASALRLEFSINSTTGSESVQLQMSGGLLSMKTPYNLDRLALDGKPYPYDDFVRGFAPGQFAVSKIYTQVGFISDGIGSDVSSDVDGFKVYDGGLLPAIVNGVTEKWNDIILMVRDNQLWVWWNGLLISPDKELSSKLPTPVAVTTQYWPINKLPIGKFGFRLWPEAVIRDITVSDQLDHFNEFMINGSGVLL